MKKRNIIVATLCLCMLLAACGNKSPNADNKKDNNTANQATVTSTAVSDPASSIIAERKAKAKETGEYKKVVFSFFDWTGVPKGLQRVNKLISDYTKDKLGLDVELTVMDSASYAQNVRLMLSSGEQIDLFNSCLMGYTASVNSGFCYNLEKDNLVQTYGKDILSTVNPDYIKACRINNILYGLPQMRDMAMSPFAVCIGQEYLDGIGYDYNSMYKDPKDKNSIRTNLDTINDIFAKLHAKYPDKKIYAAATNITSQASQVDFVGGDTFGVLLDPAKSLKVSDFFKSDSYSKICKMVYGWNKSGYISKDALTDDTSASARIKAGSAMAMIAQGKPGYKTQISGECGRPMVVFQLQDDILKSNGVTGILWHISQTSPDPVAAMQVFNAFYSDPYLSNLIIWGQEGKDYVQTSDGHATFPKGMDANSSEYYHTMNWLMPNQFLAHVWEGNSLDLWDKTVKFNDNALKSKALGFTFDNSKYAAEFTALTNVYNAYGKMLECGFTNPDQMIPQMEDKLKKAGLDTYIAAKQKALDNWAKANGIN
jgi:putative aldouronate transport system substrate-binding protein